MKLDGEFVHLLCKRNMDKALNCLNGRILHEECKGTREHLRKSVIELGLQAVEWPSAHKSHVGTVFANVNAS